MWNAAAGSTSSHEHGGSAVDGCGMKRFNYTTRHARGAFIYEASRMINARCYARM